MKTPCCPSCAEKDAVIEMQVSVIEALKACNEELREVLTEQTAYYVALRLATYALISGPALLNADLNTDKAVH